ncbi:MAG: acetyl-CoA hydrolase/transferase C-terminal domain-containing protein, partial [Oscillospiraceae bacterium]
KADGVLHSNVVPWLPEGSIVTTPKNFVMYLVSEWGVADVYLKSLKERICTIIEIAHPDFRAELKEKICTTPLISEEDFDNIAKFNGK